MSDPDSVAESIIIPTNIKPVDYKYVYGELVPHIYAFVDGTAKYIPVDKDASLNGTLSVLSQDGKAVNSLFCDKLCVYAIDKYGIYHIRGLGSAIDMNGKYVGIETESTQDIGYSDDENVMFLAEDAQVIANVQRADGDDGVDYLYLGSRENIDKAYLKEDTKVIVRTYFTDSDTYEWTVHEYNALMYIGLSSDGYTNLGHNIPTETISYLLSNKTDGELDEYLRVAFITNTYCDDSEYDVETFTLSNCNYRWSDVEITDDGHAVLTSTHTDTSIGIDGLNIDTTLYKKIRIRMKAEYTSDSSSNRSQLFFKRVADGDASFSEEKSYVFGFENSSVVDEEGWLVVEIDLSNFSRWNGVVKEIRFDPTDLMAKYTFDYIRFIKNGKYEAMTDEELEGMYTPTRLLADEHYKNGFDVRPSTNSSKVLGTFEYDGADTDNTVWAIDPWWTYNGSGTNYWQQTNCLIANRDTTLGQYVLADVTGSKRLEYNPEINSLSMSLNCSKIYNGTPHYKDDPSTPNVNEENRKWWPHLLIEQDSVTYTVDKARNTAAADRYVFEMDIRMPEYTPTTNTDGVNRCQYLVYFYLFSDKYPGQRIWFGLGLFDDHAGILYNPTWNRDSAALQMIYCVPQETIYQGIENSFLDRKRVDDSWVNTPLPSDEWKTIRVDMTPHIDRAMEWANRDNVFGGEAKKEDFYFGGVNIGFESHGNVDCTFEIKNCNLVSYSAE